MNYRKSMLSMQQNLEKTPLIKRYNLIRNEHSILINDMFHDLILNIDRYEPILLKQQSINFELDPNINDQAQLLADLLFYPHLKDGNCMCQIYLEEHKQEEHRDMLLSMLESRLSLFKFISRDEATGIVQLYDLVNEEQIEIVDKKFGMMNTGSIYYAGRIISYNGISFLTGINYFFPCNSKTNKYMKNIINDFKYKKSCDVLVKLYQYHKREGI